MSQDLIKQKFKQFVDQAQKGCGRQFCTKEFCRSNPQFKMNNEEIGIKGIELYKNKNLLNLKFCEIIPQYKSFTEIKEILENCQQKKDFKEWKDYLKHLFSHEDSIIQTFGVKKSNGENNGMELEIQQNSKKMEVEEEEEEEKNDQSENNQKQENNNNNGLEEEFDETQIQAEKLQAKENGNGNGNNNEQKVQIEKKKVQECILDIEKINQFYELILKDESEESKELKKDNKDIFELQLLKLLKKFNSKQDIIEFYKREEYLNLLIFIQLYPDLLEKTNQDLNQCVFMQFSELSKDQQEILITWSENAFTKKQIILLIQNLQSQLAIQFLNEEQMGQDVYDEISKICKVLRILYESNTRSKKCENSEFVSEFLKENPEYIDPKTEYIDYLKHQKSVQQGQDSKHFSFVDYTFLMDVNLKQQFLEIENDVEQHINQQRGIQQMLRSGDIFNNPLQFQLSIKVRRNHILDDTLKQITQTRNWKLKLQIVFEGEQGIDEGGVQKEFFVLLIKELFNLNFGMFVQKNDHRFHWFNGDFDDMPIYFELVGIILGLAIYNNVLLDIKFPTVVYKKLLNKPLSIEDIKEFDPEIYDGLKHIQDYQDDDLQESLITFEVKYESVFEQKSHLLKENGHNIIVNQQNKKEYIQLYLDWFLNQHIAKQFNSFKKGFDKVTNSSKFLQQLEAEELQQIIVGCDVLDFNELRNSCKYADGYTPQNRVIKEFWDLLLNEFTLEQQKRFLFFMSGSDRAPVQGLKVIKMIIVRQAGDTEKLPSSSTCFNHFFLPEYATKEKLKQKLLIAMENAEGFGLL